MYEFKKGDPKNLAGKAILYSALKEPQQGNKEDKDGKEDKDPVCALYLTTDLDEFLDKTGAPEELKDDLKGLEKRINEGLSKFSPSFKMPLVLPIPMDEDSEDEILEMNVPLIIKVGEYSNLKRCVRSLAAAALYYSIEFEEQCTYQHLRSQTLKKDIKKYYSVRDLKETMLKEYVMPLIKALESGVTKEAKQLEFNLYRFSMGSRFINEIRPMIDLIEDTNNPNRGKLIEFYLDKVNAINSEQYEKAGEINKKMEQLKTG